MPRITVKTPDEPEVYTKLYNRFAGVDFSTDPTQVDDTRSPYAVNVISDAGGCPHKRPGWRTLTRIIDSESCKQETVYLAPSDLSSPDAATLDDNGFSIISAKTASFEDMSLPSGSDSVRVLHLAADDTADTCILRIKCPSCGAGTYNLEISYYCSANVFGADTEISIDGSTWYTGPVFGNGEGGYTRTETKKYYFDIEFKSADDTADIYLKCTRIVMSDLPCGNHIYLMGITLNRIDEHALRINGIWWLGTAECYLVHAGSAFYKWDGEDEFSLLYSDVNDACSSAYIFGRKLYILTGAEYLVFDGENVVAAQDMASCAYIITGRDAGQITQTKSHGSTYQPFNMLGGAAKVGFTVSDEGCISLDMSGLGLYVKSFDDIEVSGSAGGHSVQYIETAAGTLSSGGRFDNAAPLLSISFGTGNTLPLSEPVGADTIWVSAPYINNEYRERINKCTIITGFSNRVFFSGNPDYPNTDWHSELSDPLYISDLSYTEVGEVSEKSGDGAQVGERGSAIVGYARYGDRMAVFKQDNGQDATLHLRSCEMSDNDIIFPIKQGISGNGVISSRSIALLHDDPMFLSKRGVFAIAHEDITAESVLSARSTRINSRLTQEENPENAVAVVWNGYYILCINGHAYIADGRQRTYARNLSGAYEYEWYYWDNIPARVLCEHDGILFFGTEDGRICRFNTDIDGAYAYNDDSAAVVAEWSTAMSNDGDFNRLKHLRRRGSGVHLAPSEHGGVKVLVRTDRDFGVENISEYRGIFSFERLDFEYFTFNTSESSFVMFGRKVKDYRTIQIICRNDSINSDFGVFAVQYRFVTGYFGK